MTLAGTRPPTVDEWDKYELHHRARLATKPGLTGMWQVSGRSNITDFEEVVKLDKQYISEWTIALSISVLSRYLTMRQFKNYIFLSILTGVVLLIGRSVLLKICNITGVAVLDILKDNISAATVLIVSFVINGIIGVIRKVIRKFFS